ncbi:hypothetical protein F1880_008514 [Penicillium rolfsii]|nr:hypothetical protein F1880_008514 [Penicillium rolfsii]
MKRSDKVQGWRQLYEPLYAEIPNSVSIVKDEQYGPADRNRLDVYYSRENNTEGKPVILFVHGGGFFSGGKDWSEKCWANVGIFFAQRGFVTVLANHRLVPHVEYPGGADDMQLAREWIFQNIEAARYGQGSKDKVVLLGHSSGGAHIAMNLYAAGKGCLFKLTVRAIDNEQAIRKDRRKPQSSRRLRA